MQIKRLDHNSTWLGRNNHWLGIKNGRRRIAELHLTINTRADLATKRKIDNGLCSVGSQAAEHK
jgi:hypothetical protein